MRHFMIAACQGHDHALDVIKNQFKEGQFTKQDFEIALRSHQAAKDAVKSHHRKNVRAIDHTWVKTED